MSDFNLELPSEEEVKEEVLKEVSPTEKEKQKINEVVQQKTSQVMSVNLDSIADRVQYTKVFQDFGADLMQKSEKNNAIMQRRMVTLSKQGGESGDIARGLEDLTIKMKDMDPGGIDFTKTGMFGKLFNPARRYFEKFKTADQEIGTIIDSLDKGKKILQADNTTLELEQAKMRELTKEMMRKIEMGIQLDTQISSEVENARITGEDEEKIKFVEEELQYPLRQRIEDFQQMLVVNQQGIVAMEIIRRNNRELIRSVDRAKMVTVNALRIAVMVASSLYDEKIVIEKINALNATTNHMIETTARMLHEQGVQVHELASNTAISTDTLRTAFAETLQALDDISTYKQEALPRMKAVIAEFQEMAAVGEQHIKRLEKSKDFTELG